MQNRRHAGQMAASCANYGVGNPHVAALPTKRNQLGKKHVICRSYKWADNCNVYISHADTPNYTHIMLQHALASGACASADRYSCIGECRMAPMVQVMPAVAGGILCASHAS
jgi:hypothetical protein